MEPESYPEPPAETRVWRYMDFVKFVAMLEHGGLYFSRADLLDDPFEGTFTPGSGPPGLARKRLLQLLRQPPPKKTGSLAPPLRAGPNCPTSGILRRSWTSEMKVDGGAPAYIQCGCGV
jgi:hypothetical protein